MTNTNIVPPLIWLKRLLLPFPARMLWLASLPGRLPWWLLLDQFSRRASNRSIYSCYRGLPAGHARQLAAGYYLDHIRPKLFSPARLYLEKLRRAGVRLVLVTGSLDFLMAPLADELAADCIAPSLEEKHGRFTGELVAGPLTGAGKAQAMVRHAAQHGIDLAASYALGDAIGDLQMLERVGHPLAVNPDRRLAAAATQRGWPIERWKA